jgi:hypothetical protein
LTGKDEAVGGGSRKTVHQVMIGEGDGHSCAIDRDGLDALGTRVEGFRAAG